MLQNSYDIKTTEKPRVKKYILIKHFFSPTGVPHMHSEGFSIPNIYKARHPTGTENPARP